jgi:hypothetical protein
MNFFSFELIGECLHSSAEFLKNEGDKLRLRRGEMRKVENSMAKFEVREVNDRFAGDSNVKTHHKVCLKWWNLLLQVVNLETHHNALNFPKN